jgi:hypothetical protein
MLLLALIMLSQMTGSSVCNKPEIILKKPDIAYFKILLQQVPGMIKPRQNLVSTAGVRVEA